MERFIPVTEVGTDKKRFPALVRADSIIMLRACGSTEGGTRLEFGCGGNFDVIESPEKMLLLLGLDPDLALIFPTANPAGLED